MRKVLMWKVLMRKVPLRKVLMRNVLKAFLTYGQSLLKLFCPQLYSQFRRFPEESGRHCQLSRSQVQWNFDNRPASEALGCWILDKVWGGDSHNRHLECGGHRERHQAAEEESQCDRRLGKTWSPAVLPRTLRKKGLERSWRRMVMLSKAVR